MHSRLSRIALMAFGVCLWAGIGVAGAQETPANDQVFELGEIVVSSPASQVEAAGSVDVITAADIKEGNARTLDEALDLVPGIYVRRGKKGVPRIDMRGMRTRQIELLLNGIPINSSYDNQFDPSFIPVENIARIKVTRGAGSVLYGSGGNAGVINIITKRGAEGVHGSLNGEAAQGDAYLGRGTLSARNENGNIFISGSTYNQESFPLADGADVDSRLEGGDERENSDRESSHLFTSMELTPTDQTTLALNLEMQQGEYGRPHEVLVDEFTDKNYDKDDPTRLTFERVTDRSSIGGQLALSHDLSGPLSFKTWGYATQLEQTVDRFDDKTYTTQNKGRHTESTTSRYGLAGQVALDLHRLGVATLAASAEQGNWDSREEKYKKGAINELNEIDKNNNIYSTSLQYEVAPTNALGLVAGAGWHQQEKHSGSTEADFSYQLGGHYDLTATTRLKANHARKIRFPSLRRLYEGDDANPDLEAEVTWHYEAGVEQDIPGWQTKLGLTLFHIDAEDFIEKIGDEPYKNQDKYRFQGIEATLANESVDNLRLEAAYTYLQSENRSDERDSDKLQNRPENKVSLKATYTCPWDLKISGSYLYVGERHDFSKVTDGKTITLDPYQVVNLKLSKTLPKTGWEFYAGVDNLFDEAYAENYALPRPGRTVYGGVEYSF